MLNSVKIAEQVGEVALAEHADAIRTLGKRVIGDVIEIGRRLAESKKLCGHGNWLPWLEREFGWSERTARRYISAFEFAGNSDKLSDLEIGVSSLYMLASPSTPDEVRIKITDRAAAGETVTVADVRAAKSTASPATTVKADRRRVTRDIMDMLDVFEHDDVDPAVRAAFLIEHFDLEIAGHKLSIRRLSRAIDSIHAVFRSIAIDLDTAHRSAPEGRPEPAPRRVVVR